MTIFTVHLPPGIEGDEAAVRMRLVPDGFSFAAFAFPFLWSLLNGLFLVAALYIAANIAVILSAPLIGLSGVLLLLFLLHLGMGLEAAGLRRFTLRRRGWREVGEVSGGSGEAAALRAFQELAAIAAAPAPSTPPAAPAQRAAPRRAALAEPAVVGLDHG